MHFIDTEIPEVKIIEPRVFGDDRGFFMETWRHNTFEDNGLPVHFVQDNHSKSKQGILRGLHYQTQASQGKLVRVVTGEVFDVAVDMRQSSSTFGQWIGVTLSAENKRSFYVPEGFAHGFYVTSDYAEFTYKCTNYYAPEHEVSLKWDDPSIGIEWPLINDQAPQLSAKDEAGLSFADAPKMP